MGPLEALIVLILVGIPVLIVFFIVSRMRSRACPRCGRRVKTGRMTCKACGFDFNTVGQAQ